MRALPVRMLPHPSLAALRGSHRFLVIDGSGSRGPGARGTQYRVHLCMELVPLSLPCMAITDQRTGECLKHFALEPGEVAVADRSSCQPETDEQPFMALEQADLREIDQRYGSAYSVRYSSPLKTKLPVSLSFASSASLKKAGKGGAPWTW
jgi:hypothetical protein